MGLSADSHFMARAIEMAERGLGLTAPNPSVGTVLVRQTPGEPPREIAAAVTAPGGRPHAEAQALEAVGQDAAGATLYVTLEPCSHHGRTGPCADAIIEAGIARVVAGIADPDPRVSGRGFKRLQSAGIEVTVGVLAEAARQVTLGHILRVTEKRPFVVLKIAVDRDGHMPLGQAGKPLFVTGPETKALVHRMRAEADAILTGIGTVLADDPELTCRIAGLEDRSPIRVVIDSDGRMPETSKLARSAGKTPVWAMTAGGNFPDGVISFEVPHAKSGAGLSLRAILETLGQEGITRVMVEAGPNLSAAFLAADLIDDLVVFQAGAAMPAGAPKALPFAVRGLEALADPVRFAGIATGNAGADTRTLYRRTRR